MQEGVLCELYTSTKDVLLHQDTQLRWFFLWRLPSCCTQRTMGYNESSGEAFLFRVTGAVLIWATLSLFYWCLIILKSRGVCFNISQGVLMKNIQKMHFPERSTRDGTYAENRDECFTQGRGDRCNYKTWIYWY